MTDDLGTLKQVELRSVWQNEAGNFTPWLAREENLSRLGRAIDVELELIEEEKGVGPFRADILCRSVTDDVFVLIENQLEQTDHNHLGQLLTYTAGLDTALIVWVAKSFRDEHRAALDWLNEMSPSTIAFFGLEIELWQIGDSAIAPKFNVVARPNEWTRTLVQKSSNSENAQLCHDYWTGVLEALRPSGILTSTGKPARKQDISFPVGWKTILLKSYFSRPKKKFGIWVAVRGDEWQANYDNLFRQKAQIEQTYGGELNFNTYTDSGTIFAEFEDKDPLDRSTWQDQHNLLAERLVALYKAVAPYLPENEEATM